MRGGPSWLPGPLRRILGTRRRIVERFQLDYSELGALSRPNHQLGLDWLSAGTYWQRKVRVLCSWNPLTSHFSTYRGQPWTYHASQRAVFASHASLTEHKVEKSGRVDASRLLQAPTECWRSPILTASQLGFCWSGRRWSGLPPLRLCAASQLQRATRGRRKLPVARRRVAWGHQSRASLSKCPCRTAGASIAAWRRRIMTPGRVGWQGTLGRRLCMMTWVWTSSALQLCTGGLAGTHEGWWWRRQSQNGRRRRGHL